MHFLTLDNFLKLFFLLMPLSFIIGPAVINFNIFLLFINYLLIIFLKKNIEYSNIYRDKFFLFFCVFFFYLIFLSLISNDILFSLKSSLSFIKFLFIYLAFKYLLSNKILSFKLTIIVFVLVIIFVVIDSSFQIIFGSNLFFIQPEYGQFSGVFGQEHILGSYLSRTLFLLAIFLTLFKSKNKKKYSIFILILVGVFISILFSGERTAVLNLFLFFSFTIIFKVIRINLISFITVISILLSGSLFIINNDYLYDRYVQTNIDQFYKYENLSIPLPDHYYLHYLTALKIFKDNPVIGIGPNMFRKYCNKDNYFSQAGDLQEIPEPIPHVTGKITPEEIELNAKISRLNTLNGCSTHPHHMHIQILTELGFIGYIFFVLFFIYIILNFFKNRPITNVDKFLLIGIFINLFPFLPSGNFFGSYFNFLAFLPILFFLNRKYFLY